MAPNDITNAVTPENGVESEVTEAENLTMNLADADAELEAETSANETETREEPVDSDENMALAESSVETTALTNEDDSGEDMADSESEGDSSESSESAAPAVRKNRRRNSPPTVEEQLASELLSQADLEPVNLAEKRREARAKRMEQSDGAAVPRTRGEAIREARAREQEFAARRQAQMQATMEWTNLTRLKEQDRIVPDGQVQAVEEIDGRIVAVLSLHGFRAIIPFENFYLSNPILWETVHSPSDLRRRQTQMLTKIIGLRTSVLIKGMIENKENISNSVILADRKAMLERLNEQVFGKGARAIRSGDVVSGQITSVGPAAVRVLIGGTEAVLPKHLATNRYVEYMGEMFSLNQEIEVTVREIGTDKDGLPSLRIDALDSERETMIENLNRIRVDGHYIGRITHIRTQRGTNKIIYNLYLPMQDVTGIAIGVPVQYTTRMLNPGDNVVFQAVEVKEQGGFVYGRILRQC